MYFSAVLEYIYFLYIFLIFLIIINILQVLSLPHFYSCQKLNVALTMNESPRNSLCVFISSITYWAPKGVCNLLACAGTPGGRCWNYTTRRQKAFFSTFKTLESQPWKYFFHIYCIKYCLFYTKILQFGCTALLKSKRYCLRSVYLYMLNHAWVSGLLHV